MIVNGVMGKKITRKTNSLHKHIVRCRRKASNMNINFDELREIVLERLDGEVDVAEFDKVWEKRTTQSEDAINQWLGEALLNNYLRYLEIGSMIEKK